MKSVGFFLIGWLIGFLALSLLVSVLFGIMHISAMVMYWGDAMPPAPWFIWRFFISISFFASFPAGVYAVVNGFRL